jgi:Uma2 family endonuclease
MVAFQLAHLIALYAKQKKTPFNFAPEADLVLQNNLVRRVDVAGVLGSDLAKFRALRVPSGVQEWRYQNITIPPTLIIESVSQGHSERDRVEKRREYAAFGVPNYFIVDVFARRLDVLRLENGGYRDDAVATGEAVVEPSAFPGLAI